MLCNLCFKTTLFVFLFQLHIDMHAEPGSPEAKEEDFFSAHTKDEVVFDLMADQKLSTPLPVKNGAVTNTQGEAESLLGENGVLSSCLIFGLNKILFRVKKCTIQKYVESSTSLKLT